MTFYLPAWLKIVLLSLLIFGSVFYAVYFIVKNKPIYSSKSSFKKIFGNSISEMFRNTYELIKSLKTGDYSVALTQKAIEERTNKLEDHISSASFKKKSVKHRSMLLLYLLIGFTLCLIPFVVPKYNNALQRVIHANETFVKPLKYKIEIINTDFSVYRNSNYTLKVSVTGEELPSELYIQSEGIREKLQKKSNTQFEYEFVNVKQNTDFKLVNDEYNSPEYTLKVIDKPKILNYTLWLNYPPYLGKQNEILQNQNSILVPKGTQVLLKLVTEGTDHIKSNYGTVSYNKKVIENQVDFSYYIINQDNIMFYAQHDGISYTDSVSIQCNVLEDEYPQIKLDISQDSVYDNILYFKGEASDDYGISNMVLNVNIVDQDGKTTAKKTKLPLPLNLTHVAIDEIVNLENYYTVMPRKIELNVEVIDNDAINRGKKTVSVTKVIVFKSEEEKQKELNTKNDANVSNMNSMITETNKIDKELENIKRSIQETNKKDWSTQKRMEALKKRMDELKQKMDALNQQLNQMNNLEKLSEEQKENKKNLEKQVNEELKKQLEEMMKAMEELLKKTNPNAIQNKLEEIKNQNENLKENLNKNVEQYKNMEFDKRFEQSLSKLQDLIDKQEKVNQVEISPVNKDAVKKDQEEINKQFNDFQKQMDELRQLNNSMEQPNKLENTEKQEQTIDKQLQNSSEQLNNGKTKKAKESQKNAQQGMKELKDQLEKNKEKIDEENLAEDIDQVREILENLIKISFDQEKIMKKFTNIKPYDPALPDLIREQSSMKGNFEVIKDSLTAIAKRQPEVQSMVFKELNSILLNFDKISAAMFDKKITDVVIYQRYVMTSTNNLALFLAESLKKMKSKESKMKSNSSCKKKGNNTCNNPGNSKKQKDSKAPNMEKIRKKQEGLNKKMPKPGQKLGQGQGMDKVQSEALARLAAEQEAIRKMLQQYLDNMKQEGQGYDGKLEKMMKDMEQSEKDIVNKKINQNTINRQEEILTRMLESEKAEMKREKEELRESKEGQQLVSPTAKYMEFLQKNKKGQKEMLKKVPIPLKLYYKDKVSKYFINFGG